MIKLSNKIILIVAVVCVSSVVFLFNVSHLWSMHGLQASPSPQVDRELFLRKTLFQDAVRLATDLKKSKENLLSSLMDMQHDLDLSKSNLQEKPVKGNSEVPLVEANLPGADKHPILKFDDKQFASVTVDEMIAMYPKAAGKSSKGLSCDDDFGHGLVERWRKTRKTYCDSDGKNIGTVGGLKSTVDCMLVRQSAHGGNGDNLCHMKNIAVDLSAFGDDTRMQSIIEKYVSTKHWVQPYVDLKKGSIQAACEPVPELWDKKYMPGWNADWTTESIVTVNGNHDVVCDHWIEEDVLIDQRDTFANFFHDSEDFVNVFLALGILEWSVGKTQIYLTDLYPKGPFWDIWQKPFGIGYTPLTSWDLRQKFAHTEKKTTCFRNLVVGIYGPASPLTVASWDTECIGVPLVKAYSDFIIRGMNLQSSTHYAQAVPSKIVTVTYMARRSTSEWPEKKYCDDENSFFLCKYWESFGIRSLGRTVSNEDELLRQLKRLENENFSNGAIVRVQDVDYNTLSFQDQIKIDAETDIMIGPHGAGLMHSLFMRDRGILIEMFVAASGANRHFHNMAFWYGRVYHPVFPGMIPNTAEISAVVRQTVNDLNLDEY